MIGRDEEERLLGGLAELGKKHDDKQSEEKRDAIERLVEFSQMVLVILEDAKESDISKTAGQLNEAIITEAFKLGVSRKEFNKQVKKLYLGQAD